MKVFRKLLKTFLPLEKFKEIPVNQNRNGNKNSIALQHLMTMYE